MEIINIVLEEEDGDAADRDRLMAMQEVTSYSRASAPLSLVRFRCFLQDTGYPKEIYMRDGRLEERWIGWATQVPGEQAWCRELSMDGLGLGSDLPDKYPLGGGYLGALVKVYGEGFAPASVHTLVGVVSTGYLGEVQVPAIHVLREEGEREAVHSEGKSPGQRDGLIDYLATAFTPSDRIAGEVLLLALMSAPASRQPLLGTLSVNFLNSGERFAKVVQSVMPVVVQMSLTRGLLEEGRFAPRSDGQDLEPGRLQLAPGTVLIVDDGIEEGELSAKAVQSLRDLSEVMTEQKLRYDYPYMDGLKMDCAVRVVVLSKERTLLPVDIVVGRGRGVAGAEVEPDLPRFRRYLGKETRLDIPGEVGTRIQEDFVGWTGDKVEALTRRMRLARLLALAGDGTLGVDVWERAIWLDEQCM